MTVGKAHAAVFLQIFLAFPLSFTAGTDAWDCDDMLATSSCWQSAHLGVCILNAYKTIRVWDKWICLMNREVSAMLTEVVISTCECTKETCCLNEMQSALHFCVSQGGNDLKSAIQMQCISHSASTNCHQH